MANYENQDNYLAKKRLSSIMDVSRVASIKTINTGDKDCVFIETTDENDKDQNDKNNGAKRPSSQLSVKKRKKITMISTKKHRDGSTEVTRQDIYKNYGLAYANDFERNIINRTPMGFSRIRQNDIEKQMEK